MRIPVLQIGSREAISDDNTRSDPKKSEQQ